MADWCDNCGLCCMHMRTPPLTAEEHALLPDDLRAGLDAFAESPRFHYSNGENGSPCVWLDRTTGGCSHYEHRPTTCREFQVGSRGCLMLRRAASLTIKGMPVVRD